jgi:hypothetical protein
VTDPFPPVRKMRLVRRPDPSRCHLIPANVAPALKGEGGGDYACAFCGRVLLESVSPERVQDVAVRCVTCGRYNDVPPAQPAP